MEDRDVKAGGDRENSAETQWTETEHDLMIHDQWGMDEEEMLRQLSEAYENPSREHYSEPVLLSNRRGSS